MPSQVNKTAGSYCHYVLIHQGGEPFFMIV
uniref:Uncharacterized protein n=1 Tax=Anguilla anguilla TaxID=7936 RepID=A0A0E9UH79_ANGAN